MESERVVSTFYSGADCGGVKSRADFGVDDAPECVYVTYGTIVDRVLEAKDKVEKRLNSKVGVVLIEILKPYDKLAGEILPYLKNAKRIVFVEEGIKYGGAAMLLRDALELSGFDFGKCKYLISAIDDNFASPEEECDLYDYVGLSSDKLAEKMING